jgi:DNA-binding transcriptional regulator LsrR (DeoR family)
MAQRNRKQLRLTREDTTALEAISNSRTEPASRVQRAKILIDYSSGMSIATIAKKYSTNRPLVERSIDRALEYGPI